MKLYIRGTMYHEILFSFGSVVQGPLPAAIVEPESIDFGNYRSSARQSHGLNRRCYCRPRLPSVLQIQQHRMTCTVCPGRQMVFNWQRRTDTGVTHCNGGAF